MHPDQLTMEKKKFLKKWSTCISNNLYSAEF